MFLGMKVGGGMAVIPKELRLSRAQIRDALDTIPMERILTSVKLTPKQRKFAKMVAQGYSQAQAYLETYGHRGKMKMRPAIQKEIEAYKMAMEAAEIRTPQYLRQLVIQSLVNLVIDETVSAGTRVQAIKALGQITEVAAFTEKRTVEHVLNPEVLKKQITETLRGMSDDVVDVDALLVEVRGGAASSSSALKSVDI